MKVRRTFMIKMSLQIRLCLLRSQIQSVWCDALREVNP